MTPLQAAADRVRRHNSGDRTVFMSDPGEIVTMCKRYVDDLDILADAYLALHPVATAMLDVLTELQESASYWSEYDVPCGIADRINTAVADGRNALSLEEQPT